MKIALHHLLFIAAALGDKHSLNRWLLKELIDCGADVLSRDGKGATALRRLHFWGHSDLSGEFLGCSI